MKAKEYFEQYKKNPTTNEIVKIVNDMFLEVKTVADMRHAKSDEAFISIMNEQIDKWRKFADLVGGGIINPDGFKMLVAERFPFVPQERLK